MAAVIIDIIIIGNHESCSWLISFNITFESHRRGQLQLWIIHVRSGTHYMNISKLIYPFVCWSLGVFFFFAIKTKLSNMMLSERSLSQVTTYRVTACPWNVWNRESHRHRQQMRGRGDGEWPLPSLGLLFVWWKCSGIRQWWYFHNPANTLKAVKLYAS